ncbi:hypothetical protein ABIE65_003483 [Constrictibacter sp. MBR-5]|jgi:hypothetical protein|uniref:hypothetical protein n=1 Tax=Constrictibacter sp. MBR-5 TaxID=3156467 RepID=UPI003395D325
MSRTAAARRVAAALAAVAALGSLALAAIPAAGQEAGARPADRLAGRWSGTWTDFSDGAPVPISVAIDTFGGGGAAEATVTYRLLSGRSLERRLTGFQAGNTARFDMGDEQYLVCTADASGRLRVRIVNPRSTTSLLLERDPVPAPGPAPGDRPASVAAAAMPDPPPVVAPEPGPRRTEAAPQPPVGPTAARADPGRAESGLGVWSGRWHEPGSPGSGRGPLRVEVADAGDGMRLVHVSGVAGVTGPAVVSERQLRAEGLVLPVGPSRDLVLAHGSGDGLRLRLLMRDTVLMALLTKEAAVAETVQAAPPVPAAPAAQVVTIAPAVPVAPARRSAVEAPRPEVQREARREPPPDTPPESSPGPQILADIPGLDLPFRPDLVLPGPVAADDPLAEAYAGIWIGQWDDGRGAALVIDDVTASGARLVYTAPGDDAPSAPDAAADGASAGFAVSGRFGGDVLEFAEGGAAYRFMRTGPDVADATAMGVPGRAFGTFLRAWRPERTAPAAPDPPPTAGTS